MTPKRSTGSLPAVSRRHLTSPAQAIASDGTRHTLLRLTAHCATYAVQASVPDGEQRAPIRIVAGRLPSTAARCSP
eukprot:3522384-Lingulodinium_polyedra.AAC.1